MPSNKTTKKDFELFKKECQKWIETLGLKDWEVFYTHEKDKGLRSSACFDVVAKMATINFSKEWKSTPLNNSTVKKSAFHEVTEGLLLARLIAVARTRFVNPEEVEEASHDIVRRLENSFFMMGN